ncbi:MAG TPA: site-specific integrase [Blastocatellia bacterium]|nr:site-specific integrase [Blastocatellia bacterium]
MAKERRGMIFQRGANVWYARITFTDESGKRRYIKRRAENKSHARELVKLLLREYEDHGERALESAQMTFNELAEFYKETYLVEPQYIDDRKVAGLRSAYDFRLRLTVLQDYFGKRKLRAITHGDIERFRAIRLQTKTRHGKQRSIATVNRELSLLRRIFNVAARSGWIIKNPFYGSVSLITPGDEKPRERTITKQEEERLLEACIGPRAHLRPIIICALDTGMRRGEIFKLQWSDIDFDSRIITVRAFNTKTMRERQVAITERLFSELEALYEVSTKQPEALCFGISDNVKKSFNTVRKGAGLSDVRFHDLRHTHATRLVAAQMPLSEVGRMLGHTQANTTYRYVNANVETAKRAAAVLDEFNRVIKKEELVVH